MRADTYNASTWEADTEGLQIGGQPRPQSETLCQPPPIKQICIYVCVYTYIYIYIVCIYVYNWWGIQNSAKR
jgi:hypothetical protein